MRKNNCAKGFTLIELLVVVAIIAILVSLIVINLSTKRQASAINSLQKSAEQITTSAQLYLDDNPSATSVNVNYLVPDYMTALPDDQEVVGGYISLSGSTSDFELVGNSGVADGCVVRVVGGEVPIAEEIRTTCP